ncbi:MAG TPA: TolC family protein [Bacteroidales bacterium]|nr:TolC family protein [Bacteroidales bacterium]
MKFNTVMKITHFLPLLILLLAIRPVYGGLQAQTGKPFDLLKDDITQVLPPLKVILDSALAYSPELKFSNLQLKINKGNLHTEQAQWSQNLGVQANIGYGTFDYIYNNTLGGTTPANYTTRQSQYQYGVGGFFRLPFYDIANRRNSINIAKNQIAQAQTLIETQQNLVREQVIKQYYDMVSMQRQLMIQSKYLETARINMQMAEKSFTSGTITVDEYSRVSEIEARTESEYESIKVNFLSAYKTLEVMVGMNFNLNNENQ